MAGLQERAGSYRILFRFRGKQHAFTIGEVSADEAASKAANVDYLLMRLKQRLVQLPEGVDIVTFLEFDGEPPSTQAGTPINPRTATTVSQLKESYLVTHGNGTIEANSLDTCKLHLSHICRFLGDGFLLPELSLAKLQEFINKRAKDGVSAVTIRKEIATFRAAWNWAQPMSLIEGQFPSRGLRYPKTEEKPPFMTRAEIERQLASGGDPDVLWNCLYLQSSELAQLLAAVKEKASYPWIYPLLSFAAHTGARRSELLRLLVADADLVGKTAVIREKKRARGRLTSRRVPLTPFLEEVLRQWLDIHPGGPFLFCHDETVERSKKRSSTTGHRGEKTRPTALSERLEGVTKRISPGPSALTRNEVHDHFKRTLANTKWSMLRGLHCFRHSFISACASKGVDQRLIDEWTGHSTEQQRKRYRHLYPSTQRNAITSVFG